MTARVTTVLAVAGLSLTAAACDRNDDIRERTAADARTPAPAAPDEPQLRDLQIGAVPAGGGAEAQRRSQFAPGEAIHVSVSIEGATQGTPVTTYWYGPDGQALAYETVEMPAQAHRLQFTQENTFDWPSGQYRAEIWVGNEELGEQPFQIASG